MGIERFESVRNSKVDRAKLSQLIASVKGVMLGITFRDKPYGKIKIDFGQDASHAFRNRETVHLGRVGRTWRHDR